MRRIGTMAVVLAAGAGLGLWAQPAGKPNPQIGHMVYFQLNDNAPDKVKEAIALCQKYLSDHPGVVHFSVGTIAREFDRPVNDRDWDVALHFVFKSKADHDRYQDSERHTQFVKEIRPYAKKVRVFDAAVVAK
jgi:hypothetical protein